MRILSLRSVWVLFWVLYWVFEDSAEPGEQQTLLLLEHLSELEATNTHVYIYIMWGLTNI